MKLRNKRVCRTCKTPHVFYCTLIQAKHLVCENRDLNLLPEQYCSCGAPPIDGGSDWRDVRTWSCLFGSTKNLTPEEKEALKEYLKSIGKEWLAILA